MMPKHICLWMMKGLIRQYRMYCCIPTRYRLDSDSFARRDPHLIASCNFIPCSSVDIVIVVGGGMSSLPPHPLYHILILSLHYYYDESYVCGLVVVLTNCRSEISSLYIFDDLHLQSLQLDDRCHRCYCVCPSSVYCR